VRDCCWQHKMHVYLLRVLRVRRGGRHDLDGFRHCLCNFNTHCSGLHWRNVACGRVCRSENLWIAKEGHSACVDQAITYSAC
jgi:hypothetical protein